MTNTPGRPGAAIVVDAAATWSGIFTDGDLRRLVEQGRTDFDVPVREVMARTPALSSGRRSWCSRRRAPHARGDASTSCRWSTPRAARWACSTCRICSPPEFV